MKGFLPLFLHVPRTGGTTIRHLMRLNHESRVLEVNQEGLHRLTPEHIEHLDWVAGHFHFGAHKVLGIRPCYFAVLRDPVDRALSWYRHALARPENPQHSLAKQKGILEFCLETANHQAMAFSGGVEDVAVAIDNARRFLHVGVYERFAETIAILSDRCGWKSLEGFGRWNESPPLKEVVPVAILDRIRAANSLDCALYEWARRVRS